MAAGYPQVKSDVTYTATYYADGKKYDYMFKDMDGNSKLYGQQEAAGEVFTCPDSSYKWKRRSDGAVFSPGDQIELTEDMWFDEYMP